MILLQYLEDLGIGLDTISFSVLFLLSVVQISPIKIKPWTYLGNLVGNTINGDILNKINKLKCMNENTNNQLMLLREELHQDRAITCRVRILRFEEELLQDMHHSKEAFDQVMGDINYYEQYCKHHPDFLNNMINLTIQHIKKVYLKQLEDRGF